MAKKRPAEKKEGEQGFLIDVLPKNQKTILRKAKQYRGAMLDRMAASEREVELKNELLALIKAAKLQPMTDGKIKLSIGEYTISVTPREMLIQVKFSDKDAGDDE